MGPPDTPRVVGSCRVRSGETAVQLCPSLVDLNSTLAPVYSTCASCGEIKSGDVHWKRYFPSPAGWPSGLSGQGVMMRARPVLWSPRPRKPELSPPNVMSGSSRRAWMWPDSPATSYHWARSIPPGQRLGPHTPELSCWAPHTRYGKWLVVVTW